MDIARAEAAKCPGKCGEELKGYYAGKSYRKITLS